MPNRSLAPQTEATYFPRRRCPGFFHVVFATIRPIGFFRTPRSLRRLRWDGSWSGVPLIGKNTEAAPNSSTGSGHCLSPGNDGIVSFSSLSRGSRNVAPQKPRCPSWSCRRAPQRASSQPSRRVVRNAAACGGCEGSSCHAWRRPLSSARRRGIRSVRLPATRRRRSPGCVVFPDASCRHASGVRAWLDSGLAEPLAQGSSMRRKGIVTQKIIDSSRPARLI